MLLGTYQEINIWEFKANMNKTFHEDIYAIFHKDIYQNNVSSWQYNDGVTIVYTAQYLDNTHYTINTQRGNIYMTEEWTQPLKRHT